MKSSQICLREKSSMSVGNSLGCVLTFRTSETSQTNWYNLIAQPHLVQLHQWVHQWRIANSCQNRHNSLKCYTAGMESQNAAGMEWEFSTSGVQGGDKESSCHCPTVTQVCFGWTSQRHKLGFPRTARLEKAQKQSLTFLVQLKPESAGVWKMRVDLARTFWSSHMLTTKILGRDDFWVSFKLRIVHVT